MPHSFSHSRVMTIPRPKEWMRVPSSTLASSKANKCRMLRRRENMSNIPTFWMMCCTLLLEHASTGEAMRRRRRGLIPSELHAWKKFARAIVEDGSFRLRYRMSYRDSKDLYAMLRKRLEKHDGSGVRRNGTVAGEWALAGTLIYLAGGSIYEVMDGAHIPRSTSYPNIQLGLGAILGCKRLRAMCNARYVLTAVSCIAPGSTNDRQAWTLVGFDEAVAALPDPYFVVGVAAYRASVKMLVPYPGTDLDSSRDTFNYYQSQARMPIEQTFGILVRTWGILWKPLEVPLNGTAAIIHPTVRLHNFLRRRRAANLPGPAGPARDEESILLGDIFRSPPSGRPAATASVLRENLRREIAVRTLVRPIHNVERNRGWRNQPEAEDLEEASSP